MTVRTINKYLAFEIVSPTLVGMLIFTLLILMGRMVRLVEMVLNKGVPLAEVSLLFIYMLPAFLVITLPFAFLMGVLLAFGRLSSDSEVIAMKASGISIQQMLKPVLFTALATAVLITVLTLYVSPSCNSAFRAKTYDIAKRKADVGIEPQIFIDDFDGLVLFANRMDQKSGLINGIFISDERTSDTPSTITARTGHVVSDQDNLSLRLHLVDGSIHRKTESETKSSYQVIDFASYDINLDIDRGISTFGERRKREEEMTLVELIDAKANSKIEILSRLAAVELIHRFTLPLSPFIFVLVGVPLGIQTSRSGRGGGFSFGLVVFLIYYILHSLTKTLAVDAGVTEYIVVLPTIVFMLGGAYMLKLAIMEQRIRLVDRIIDLHASLFKKFRGGRK